ncbi:potassium channel protein [Ammoniphilus sp. CFH 90114]|uniref:potassium channel protein n=1 Tax=Ammoniphilus sp. CFH 90114 TaxID=2493665 RepID=UPI0013E988B5|nr:ion channel [Ammoniphilus sp. CFH 90114]
MELIPKKLLFFLIRSRNRVFIPFVIVYVLFCSYLAFEIEPSTFGTYFNAMWWVMTTLTTVGYGDYSPITTLGRTFAMFLYITGIGIFGVVIGKVINSITVMKRWREEGKMNFTGKDHLIIVGWSAKSELAIREILTSEPHVEIVLIADLRKTPILEERVHYVRGRATEEQTLLSANILKSKGVIIFASYIQNDVHISDPILLDGKTLLVATAINALEEKYKARIHVTVEVINQDHINMFKHVRIEEFIPSYEMVSHAAVRSLFTHGVTDIYAELMSRTYGENLYEIEKRPHWNTYREAFFELLDEGATLISDGSDLYINQKLSDPIPPKAKLFVICDRETYDKIKAAPHS